MTVQIESMIKYNESYIKINAVQKERGQSNRHIFKDI